MDLLEQFERATLPGLPHADHVRVACAYLDRYGEADTLERLLAGLARFAAAKGKPDKFHYTMTRAWLELIVDARRRHPTARTADDLMRACPALCEPLTLNRFYSAAALQAAEARLGWVPPDLQEINAGV